MAIAQNIRTAAKTVPYSISIADGATIEVPAGVSFIEVTAAAASTGHTNCEHRLSPGQILRLRAAGAVLLKDTAVASSAFGKFIQPGASGDLTMSAGDEVTFRIHDDGSLRVIHTTLVD